MSKAEKISALAMQILDTTNTQSFEPRSGGDDRAAWRWLVREGYARQLSRGMYALRTLAYDKRIQRSEALKAKAAREAHRTEQIDKVDAFRRTLSAEGVKTRHGTTRTLDLAQGDLKLPSFQRGYVWTSEQALAFLDSVIKGFPVGSIFLYSTRSGWWDDAAHIIDGQQRLTTLRGALLDGVVHTTTGTHTLMLDCLTGKLGVGLEGEWVIKLTDLLTNSRVGFELYSRPGDGISCGLRAEVIKDRIRMHQIPYSIMYDCTPAQAVEAFRRINTTGTPLTDEQLARLTGGVL